jgi:hypothetical protein
MTTRSRILGVAAACLVLATGGALLHRSLSRDATLSFTVRDSVSGAWVWEASMTLQDRLITGYFQSTDGLKTYTFTHLKPGASVLEVAAPGYEPARVPVSLRPGANALAAPVSMRGREIPNLAQFIVFEKTDADGISAELRPVSATGAAIVNHPCMDLWVGARVCAQAAESVRGRELFKGTVEWRWDPSPEAVFRYTVRIPAAGIAADPSPLRVVDYLFVVPNPAAITHDELAALMDRLFALPDAGAVAEALAEESGRVRFFTETSWNVPGSAEP